MHLFSLIFISLALSLDSFNVGTTYGLRKIHIPLLSVLIIAGCSGFMLFISMGFGQFLTHFVSPQAAKVTGGLILVCIGLWALLQFFRSSREKPDSTAERFLLNVEIKKLGIVIQILRKPTVADVDRSGTISGAEALLLGAALSLDSFGAGIGAALMDYPLFWMAFTVAVMSGCCLAGGKRFGFLFADTQWLQKASFIPGLLLILIGILRM
ncbi:MAG TPA: sporulation membrane protein YtaF [Bacillales bacterium]|nr:sporulation membrane protein YtaF [Bacillales bacterium]